jgi:hypothetical protein
MNIFDYSSIICIAYLCLTAVQSNNKLSLNMICLTENSVLIITLCYSCDMISKRIQNFSEEIQDLLSFSRNYSYPIDLNQHLIQTKINFIKQEIGFTAFALIKINSKTRLCFCSDSVILCSFDSNKYSVLNILRFLFYWLFYWLFKCFIE